VKGFLLVFVLLSIGCEGRDQIEIGLDEARIRVEIAATPAARQKGLMHRESLERDEGMLFVYPRAGMLGIWMRNTLIPLDVGFFDPQGRLLNWISMQPDGGRTVYRSRGLALYALEMNRGWFERQGIGQGARLQLPYPIEAN
jgi:uncharacterized membrane protein (UPF0127 family)